MPTSEQLSAIRSGCKQSHLSFDDRRDVLPSVSCAKLASVLEAARSNKQPISILHLLCHGGQAGTTFGLVMNGEEPGETEVIDAGTLRQVLAPFADMVRIIVLSACDSGNSGPLGNQLGSVAQTLHRAGFACVIASRNPLAVSASIKLTETLYQQLLCETQSVEQSLLAVRNRLVRSGTSIDWVSLQLYARSEDGTDARPIVFRPYRGLLAFQPQHHRYFFGREREVAQIQEALRSLRSVHKPVFLVVAGASGTGKSSVVLAGVVPQLTSAAHGSHRALVLKPGSDPLRALDAALSGVDLASGSSVLIVDQLEEIFTHVSDLQVRTQFVQRLWKLAKTDNVSVIATLRVDFLGDCGDIVLEAQGPYQKLDQVVYSEAHRVFVAQLGSDQLHTIIDGPAARAGLTLEAGLTSRMVEALDSEPGALPLLQHTLDLLWLHREGSVLTQKSYDALGQLAGALAQHADALMIKLDETDQKTARKLLVRLVKLEDGVLRATRQRVTLERLRPREAASQARFDRVLGELVQARLLTQSEEDGQQTIEIAHEALIRKWPRLVQWLQLDREMLAMMMKLDAMMLQHRQHQVLWSGEQLRFAERCVSDYPDDTPEEAKELLRKSQRQQRNDKLMKRGVLAVMIAGALFYVGESVFEWLTNDRIENARKRLASLIQQTSKNPSPAELLGTLARMRLELELSASLALELNQRAHALEPQNPRLLADQAEYLLASGRFAEVANVSAQLMKGEKPAPLARLHGAVSAWTAARFLLQAEEQKKWGEHILTQYQALPAGTELEGMVGTSQILVREQLQLRPTLPLTDALELYAILRGAKSEHKTERLRKRLERSLAWTKR